MLFEELGSDHTTHRTHQLYDDLLLRHQNVIQHLLWYQRLLLVRLLQLSYHLQVRAVFDVWFLKDIKVGYVKVICILD